MSDLLGGVPGRGFGLKTACLIADQVVSLSNREKEKLIRSFLFQVKLTRLEAVHDRGIIHRDIKPANFVIGKTGYDKDTIYRCIIDGIQRNRLGSTAAPEVAFGTSPTAAHRHQPLAWILPIIQLTYQTRSLTELYILKRVHLVHLLPVLPPSQCRLPVVTPSIVPYLQTSATSSETSRGHSPERNKNSKTGRR